MAATRATCATIFTAYYNQHHALEGKGDYWQSLLNSPHKQVEIS